MTQQPTPRTFLDEFRRPGPQTAPVAPIPKRKLIPLPHSLELLLNGYSYRKLTEIERLVCERYALQPSQLHTRCRTDLIAGCRQLVMHLGMELTSLSSYEVGRYFARDHSTAVHAHQNIRDYASIYPALAGTIEEIRAKIALAP